MKALFTKPIGAGALAALLLFLPLASPILTPIQLIVPLPIMLVSLIRGVQAGGVAALVLMGMTLIGNSSAGLAALMAPISVFLFLAGFPLLAGWLGRSGWSLNQCGAAGYLVGALLLTAGYLLFGLMGWSLSPQIEAHLGGIRDTVMATLRTAQGVDAQSLALTQQGLDHFINLMALLFPGLFMTVVLVVQVSNLYLARRLLQRWDASPFHPTDGLESLRVPELWVWPLIVAIGVGMVAGGGLGAFGLNLAVFMAAPYFLQGMAVIQALFRSYRIGPMIRGFFYAMLLLVESLILVIALVGLFDTWFNFRGRMPRMDPSEDTNER
ncbi:MAG: DUF2232 domain-containing protein [Magnetococcales bacterium]|nr:DUF2232 domain-containing protein [Magnetococcales bacterium]